MNAQTAGNLFWVLPRQVQLIDAPHQAQVRGTLALRRAVTTSIATGPATRIAARSPAGNSDRCIGGAPQASPALFFEKIQLDFQLPDLLVQLDLLLVGLLAHLFAAVGEHVGQALDRLAFPKADPGGKGAIGRARRGVVIGIPVSIVIPNFVEWPIKIVLPPWI